MPIGKRLGAELLGTFWLVLGGCGSALLIGASPHRGGGIVDVSLAFGLTLLTMAYAIGHISGCHLNPAVTIGMCIGKRFPRKDVLPYIAAQVLGGMLGAAALYLIASGGAGFSAAGGFWANGYGDRSPGGYSAPACLMAEVVLTFMFVLVVLGATDKRAPKGAAPVAMGLALTAVHLVGIPITLLSANPARSTATAFIAGAPALTQLWFFWIAPLAGGAIAGIVYPLLAGEESAAAPGGPEA